jgi:alanine racemase
MTEPLNGFTGFSRKNSNFVSAGEALRQSRYDDKPFAARKQERSLKEPWNPLATPESAETPDQNAADVFRARPSQISAAAAHVNSFLVKHYEEGTPAQFDPEKLESIPEIERRWAWVEIDLNAIRHNVSTVKRMLQPGTHLLAVVKADAYGHGAVQCAKTALNSGADYLAVATVDEAITLREAYVNAPILILAQPPATAIPLLLAYKVMPTIYTADFAIAYAEAADSLGLRAPYHLKVNTGMNRIGVWYEEVVEFMQAVSFHRALDLEGVFTHFATADESNSIDFQRQVKRFEEAVNALRANGIYTGLVHAANSAAAIRFPQVQYNMVRLGIGMYGLHPCMETFQIANLKPAMSVKARITDVKNVAPNEGVSYGCNYRSPGSVKICTLPIGYADGFRRNLSGKISVLLGGKRFPQVGNICMDQCMFEINLRNRVPIDPHIGDEVVIVGEQGEAAVTLDEMADKLGTIHYELAIGFGCSRLPRLYR